MEFKNTSDIMTKRQLGYIQNLCWELGIDTDYAIRSINEGSVSNLTKLRAHQIIEELNARLDNGERKAFTDNKEDTILTVQQLATIQDMCEDMELDLKATIFDYSGEEFPEFTRKWASSIIDHLQELKKS